MEVIDLQKHKNDAAWKTLEKSLDENVKELCRTSLQEPLREAILEIRKSVPDIHGRIVYKSLYDVVFAAYVEGFFLAVDRRQIPPMNEEEE